MCKRISALKKAKLRPYVNIKKKISEMPLDGEITKGEKLQIEILAFRHRKQIPSDLIPETKPHRKVQVNI